MFKANKKIEMISSFVLIFMMICQIFLSYTTFANNEEESQVDSEEYSLNFSLIRSDYSDYKAQDLSKQQDCFVEFELHNEGQPGSIVEKMSYTADTDSWKGDVYFQNISIPYENVEIEYYDANDGNSIEPNLLHYDLYLKKSGDKMVLSVPKIFSNKNASGNANNSGLLNVKDIRVNDSNGSANARMLANPVNQQNTGNEIFLNGQAGDDGKDGSNHENAVKTFAKAKKLASENTAIERIIITATTDVEGEISLEGTNAKLFRSEDFNGCLLNIQSGKTATLKNITIDGNSENNKNIEKSLVYVNKNAILNIEDGAILRNNIIKAIENNATTGGAVEARSNAIVNMTDGIIENNQATYGGGIYLYGATLNFSAGEISKNRSDLVDDKAYKQLYSAGGGILAYEGSTINMSGSAKVINNSAAEVGGGISVGTNQAGAANILNMTGGIIDRNTAGASGGGIFIQAGLSNGDQSKAYISSGRITNNKMDGKGKTNKAFGGGGIYVNGIAEKWELGGNTYSGVNGELYLKNALITQNTAQGIGGGMACCPIAKTKIYVNNGVALYGNNLIKENVGKELFLYSNKKYLFHSGESEYKLSKLMLGGAPYNWMLDEERPLPDDQYEGKLIIPEGRIDNAIALNVNSKGNELTKALTKVVISGNESDTLGGGIGSNGSVFFGTDEETTKVSVEKKWDDNNNKDKSRPTSIKVKLMASLEDSIQEYVVEERILNKENNWKTTFTDLPTISDEKKITYTVSEEPVKGYTTKITGNEKTGFTITNSTKPPEPPEKITVEGSKIWKDAENQDGIRAEEITINLLKNGEKIASKKVTEADGWKWKFENLEKYENGKLIKYTISEEKVEGYKTEITGSTKDGFVVTNTKEPEKIKVEGLKTWNDKNNKAGIRPKSITINLFKNGEKIASKHVTAKDNWRYSFENLDKYENGKEIKYTISEDKVDNYTTEIDGFNITNTYIPPEKPPTPNTSDPGSMNILCITLTAAFFVAITVLRRKHSR